MIFTGCNGVGDNFEERLDAVSLKSKADSALFTYEYTDALKYYTDAVKVADREGNQQVQAAATCNIGIVYATFEDYERAAYYFEKSLNKALQMNDRRIASISLTNLILACVSAKDTVSLKKWIDFKSDYPLQDLAVDSIWTYYTRGLIQIRDGDHEPGRTNLEKVLKIASGADVDKEYRVMTYVDLGSSYLTQGMIDSAIINFNNALRDNTGFYNQEKEIYRRLISIYSKTGLTDSVAKYQSLLLKLNDSIYNQRNFNLARNELVNYEEELNRYRIKEANNRLIAAVCVLAIAVISLFFIITLYRRLGKTYRVLWQKQSKLISDNEECMKYREQCLLLNQEIERLKACQNVSYTSGSTEDGNDNSALQASLPEDSTGDATLASDSNCSLSDSVSVMNVSVMNEMDDNGETDDISESEAILTQGAESMAHVELGQEEDAESEARVETKLDPKICEELNVRIMKVLNEDATLYDPDLTINSIAAKLKINSKYVSQAINETNGVNFRTFINQLRLKEVCRRLSDNKTYGNLTIAAIASDCGFKSTNNFIVLFKKFIGMTPLKWRNLAMSSKD